MTMECTEILFKYSVLQCGKKERKYLFLNRHFIPEIPKEPLNNRSLPSTRKGD